MVKIIPFEEIYLADFHYNGVEQKYAKDYNIKEIIRNYASLGNSYLLFIDEKIVVVGGIYPILKDTGCAWLFINQEASNYRMTIFKAIKKYMQDIISKYNFKKVQIACLRESEEANRLAIHLGFVCQAEMIMYQMKLGD